tara:strand:+ start:72 stop:833 length:762 start_codon:yes stop_codon:yes gene_type:complete
MTETIELFYIDHPLVTAPQLSEEVLSTFSDEQFAEYSALYDLYKTSQRKAAEKGHEISRKCRDMLITLFDDPALPYNGGSKQVKYFDRMIRNGETAVDIHSVKYPDPDKVARLVARAKERIGNIAKSRVTVGGDDTLQEINNAATFLIGKGLKLNVDFTVSNAVTLATAHVQESIDIGTVSQAKGSIANYNVLLNGEQLEDATNYAVVRNSRYSHKGYTLESVAITSDTPAADQEVNIKISFCHGSKPTLELK